MLNRQSSIVNLKFFSALLLIFLTACASQPPASAKTVAAETWLADIAQNVAGDRTQVASLLAPGIDPHEFQPAPQDAIKIAQAQVLIVNGLGYESWLGKSLQNGGNAPTVITASHGLPPSPDPHAWMDPANAIRYAENIRDGLTQADPAGKDTYAANAAAYIKKLQQLDADIQAQVSSIPPEQRMLVTNHDSLGYFARAYGFKVVGAVIPSVTNEASPSAQQMAALIDTLKQTGARAIFVDAGENPALAQQIASSTGAKVVTDLYIESLSGANGPAATYIEMLRHDATVIVEALK